MRKSARAHISKRMVQAVSGKGKAVQPRSACQGIGNGAGEEMTVAFDRRKNKEGKKGPVEYPPDHEPGMRVPKGGSSCSSCEYLGEDKKTCDNKYFVKWNNSNVIPAPIDEYCSDWYEN